MNASKKCTKSSLSTRFFSADTNIVQFLKIKLHFKYFCKFLQGEYQRDGSSTEHTKLIGTHRERRELPASWKLGDWHKKDLSPIKTFGSIVSLLQEACLGSAEQQSASLDDVDEKYQYVWWNESETHSVHAIRLWKSPFYCVCAAVIVTVTISES